MRKHCSDVCKLRPCLNKESKNSARLRTIVTVALQRQYLQTELIFWISLVFHQKYGRRDYLPCFYDGLTCILVTVNISYILFAWFLL